MTAPRFTSKTVEIDGRQIPLAECDWILWRKCGCPQGVTVGRWAADEDAAWKSFYDGSWKKIAKALQRGERIELVTHECCHAEVIPRLAVRCAHEGSPSVTYATAPCKTAIETAPLYPEPGTEGK